MSTFEFDPAVPARPSQLRDRAVIFRVTAAEYRLLREACAQTGSRNLSDFTRLELFGGLRGEPLAVLMQQRFAEMEERLARLESHLAALAGLLRDRHGNRGTLS